MIQANELRIGNLILFNNNDNGIEREWIDVKGIENDKYINIGSFPLSINSVKPIPLTEDWLLKFGFKLEESIEEDDDNFHYKALWLNVPNRYDLKISKFIGDDYRVKETEKNIEVEDYPFPHVKHVHTLQNLYFALTGEELTIKE